MPDSQSDKDSGMPKVDCHLLSVNAAVKNDRGCIICFILWVIVTKSCYAIVKADTAHKTHYFT